MKSFIKILFVAALLTSPAIARAEDTTRSNNAPMSSLDKIKNRRDMHQAQINKINAYLKERDAMPANARVESDRKFLSTLRGDRKERKKDGPAKGGKKEKKRKPAPDNVNPYAN